VPQLDTNRLRVGAIGLAASIAAVAVGLLVKGVVPGMSFYDDGIGPVQVIDTLLVVAGIAGLFVFPIVLLAGWMDRLDERDNKDPQ